MAKLLDVSFRKTGKAGDIVEFLSSCTVDSSGIFYFSFPDFLQEIIKTLPEYDRLYSDYSKPSVGKVSCKYHRGQKRLIALSLETGRTAIYKAIEKYLAYELEESIVIRYAFVTSCLYAKNDDGVFAPSASEKGFKSIDNGTHCGNAGYKISIRATVSLKRLYKRGKNEQAEYCYIGNENNALGEYGKKLNSFSGINFNQIFLADIKEIPYTEKHAKMFYEAMLGLCKIADIIYGALKDSEKLLELPRKNLLDFKG